jgi:predicted DNA-binding transcriptional regulator YafY
MNRIDRLFAMVTFLQGRKYTRLEQLSERYRISERTVFRDLKALDESGIPIGFEANKGYYIVDGFFTPPIAFTREEANALVLSQKVFNGFSDAGQQTNFQSAIQKVRAAFKQSELEKIDAFDAKIKFQLPERHSQATDFMPLIQESICDEKQLELSYINAKEEVSTRIIEPIGLVFYAFSWHVIAYCHLKKDYRDFKLSRIQSLRLLSSEFAIKDHIPLGKYSLPVSY